MAAKTLYVFLGGLLETLSGTPAALRNFNDSY